MVYGAAHDENKPEFIAEMSSMCHKTTIPYLVGGDFNLVRYSSDKSNGSINHRWADNFNAWIEIWSLLEIKLSSRKYT